MTTITGPYAAAEDLTARLLWVLALCDPADPAPPWDDLDDDVQQEWIRKKEAFFAHLTAEGWQPPASYKPSHYHSALDIPDGECFRPVGDCAEFQRTGDVARRVGAGRTVTYLLSSLDVDYQRGYTAVSR